MKTKTKKKLPNPTMRLIFLSIPYGWMAKTSGDSIKIWLNFNNLSAHASEEKKPQNFEHPLPNNTTEIICFSNVTVA